MTNTAVADYAAEVVPATSSSREDGYTAETVTFEGLYGDCARPIYHFVLRSVRDPQDAEDICQEVWTRVYRRLPTLREAAAARVWLYRIARHAIIDAARRRARRPQQGALTFEPRAAATDEPAPSLIASEQAAFAWQALAALQPRQRMALYLKEVEERCYREIAEVLECSESAVETLLFRARRRFAERYGRLAESRAGRCDQARRTMAILLDGEGDAVEERAVQAHLGECSGCREALTGARQTSAARAALPLLPEPFSAPLTTGSGLAEVAATAIEAARAVIAKFTAALAGKAAVVAGAAATTGAIAVATLAPVGSVDYSAATASDPSADVVVAAPVGRTVGTSSITGVTPRPYGSSLAGMDLAVGGGPGLEAGFDALASLHASLASARAILAVELSDDHTAFDMDAALPATLHSVTSTAAAVVVATAEVVPSPRPLDVVEAASLPPTAEGMPPAGEIAQALVPEPLPLSSVLAP